MKYAKRIFAHYIKYGFEADGHTFDWEHKEEIAAAVEDIVDAAVKQVEEKYEARIAFLEKLANQDVVDEMMADSARGTF